MKKTHITLTALIILIILLVSILIGLSSVQPKRQIFLFSILRGMSGKMSCCESAGAVPITVDNLNRHAYFIAIRLFQKIGGSAMDQKNFIDYIDTIDSTRAKVDLLISLTGDKALID